MTPELTVLAWTLVLAIAQIALPAAFRTRETGVAYNAGPRDTEGPPVGIMTGRLLRAQKNLFETLPLFIAAVLILHVAGIHTQVTSWATLVYLMARVVYVPLYAFGIPYARSAVWMISMLALVLLLVEILLRA